MKLYMIMFLMWSMLAIPYCEYASYTMFNDKIMYCQCCPELATFIKISNDTTLSLCEKHFKELYLKGKPCIKHPKEQ